jgi:asparagine synthase (glutamine-hydrolysing)
MCGINGIFAYAATAVPPSRDETLATRDAMARRGPDGSGLWRSNDGRCRFGHRRLAILDLSDRALQPMHGASGRYTIVFNGEIYNYRELRHAAVAAGRPLATTSDTEILLDLYERHGSAMLDQLRGMFALAIWDAERHCLFLARDPFGIKPLYYSDRAGMLRFASQVGALRAGGAIGAELDPAGVTGFMLMGSVPEPFTWYAGIAALPAGHCMTVDARGPRLRRYIDPAAILAARHAAPDLADARTAIRDSIRAHLLSDVPVGLFLSGGIDSAAILGVAMEHAAGPIQAITLGFDDFVGTPEDEVPIAARIAAHYGARNSVRRIDRAEFLADLDDIMAAMDQPSIDGINSWFVAKAARELGLKVALSGIGGDELLGGYPSFTDVPRWRARYGGLARIPGLGRVAADTLGLLAPRLAARHPKAAGLLRHSTTLGGAYLVRRALRLPEDAPPDLPRDFVAEGLARLDIVARLNRLVEPMPQSDRAAVTLLELGFYLRNQLLRDADWAGMRHSVEIRTPLVDIALFTRLAPVIGTLRHGVGKQLLADAPTRPLPDWHRHRPKTGFRIPYAAWVSGIADKQAPSSATDDSHGQVARKWSRYILSRHSEPAVTSISCSAKDITLKLPVAVAQSDRITDAAAR